MSDVGCGGSWVLGVAFGLIIYRTGVLRTGGGGERVVIRGVRTMAGHWLG